MLSPKSVICSLAFILFLALVYAWNTISSYPSLETIEQSSGSLLYAFSEDDQPKQWHETNSSSLAFGYKSKPLWLKVSFDSFPEDSPLLIIDYGLLDHVTVSQFEGERLIATWETGDMLPFDQRPYLSDRFVFPLVFSTQQTELLIRVQSEGTLKVPLYLSNHFVEDQRAQYTAILMGAYSGFMMLMFLISIMVSTIYRDRNYLFYAAYVGAMACFNLQLAGVLFQWLWPNAPSFNASITASIIFLTAASQIVFIAFYLKLYNDRIGRYMRLFVAYCLILSSLSFIPGLYRYLSLLGVLTIISSNVIAVILATRRIWVDQNRDASDWFFLTGWTCMLIGIVVSALGVSGVLPSSSAINNAAVIASSLEVFFLLAALFERNQKDRSQRLEAISQGLDESRKREQAERHLVFQATHHPLSLLPKKEILTHEWGRLQHSLLPNQHVTMVVIHITGYYKQIATFGHDAAEHMLKTIHVRTSALAKRYDFICSIDSQWDDERVIALDTLDLCFVTSTRSQELPDAFIQNVFSELSKPVAYKDVALDIELVIGLCASSIKTDIIGLIRKAQVAANEAHRRNIHNLRYSDREGIDPEHSYWLLERFKSALESNALDMHFQPQVCLNTGSIIGVEALIRWYDSELEKWQTPDIFIPLVEQSSLISPLTDYVINRACDFLVAFKENFASTFKVSVNLSVKNLQDETVLKALENATKRTGVNVGELEFEVTETAFMGDARLPKVILSKLAELGASIALDDFGTGYTSINYLRELPFTALKIDKSLILNLSEGSKEYKLVAASIKMAEALEMDVVIEGIETSEVLNLLNIAEAGFGQGYLFSKALPQDEFFTWYKQNYQKGMIVR